VTAIQSLADELEKQLTQVFRKWESNEPAIALIVEGDTSILGRDERITQELQRLLLFRLGENLFVERVVSLPSSGGRDVVAKARYSGVKWLLRCVVGVEKEKVMVTSDLTPLPARFWDRLADPVPVGAKEHFFVSVDADKEILLLLGKSRAPPPLAGWNMREFLYLPRRVLDAGVGELDKKPGVEIAVLYDDAIEVFTMRGGNPERLTTYSVGRLPEAEIKTRDPTGSLLVADFNRDGQSEIFYKLFNRRYGQILALSNSGMWELRKLDRVPLCVLRRFKRAKILYGIPEPGTNKFTASVELVDINKSSGRHFELPGPFSSLRCWQPEDGGPAWIVISDLEGKIYRLQYNGEVDLLLDSSGAESCAVDLNRDGGMEIVASDQVWPGEDDSVRVFVGSEIAWQSRNLIGSVVAIAPGRLDAEAGVQALLVVVDSEESASRIYVLGRVFGPGRTVRLPVKRTPAGGNR